MPLMLPQHMPPPHGVIITKKCKSSFVYIFHNDDGGKQTADTRAKKPSKLDKSLGSQKQAMSCHFAPVRRRNISKIYYLHLLYSTHGV